MGIRQTRIDLQRRVQDLTGDSWGSMDLEASIQTTEASTLKWEESIKRWEEFIESREASNVKLEASIKEWETMISMNSKVGWVPDSERSNCSNKSCKKEFTTFWRKHHCRKCKDIFCADCCPSPGFFSPAKRICSDKVSCKKRQEVYMA